MGQKLAAYDAQGNITAFYDTVDSPAPAGANVIEISYAEWLACLSTPGYTVQNDQLIPPSDAQLLAQAQAAQIARLSQACANAIVSGFTSDALGSAYTYPSTPTDQMNQATIAQSSSGGLLWCEAAGSWAMKSHTQAQAQAVVASFSAWLNKCQQQLVSLVAQVNAATTVSAVQAIAWTNPQ
ncbi:hypothetical protein QZN00_12855 [Burkholderia multivorans]|nr:hypothetical protein [Burkholderia multivorans]